MIKVDLNNLALDKGVGAIVAKSRFFCAPRRLETLPSLPTSLFLFEIIAVTHAAVTHAAIASKIALMFHDG